MRLDTWRVMVWFTDLTAMPEAFSIDTDTVWTD
jgi:hypothetical protein